MILLDFEPDQNQVEIFDPSIQAGILCCTRQYGKTTCVAALTLHTAHRHCPRTGHAVRRISLLPLIPKLGIEHKRDRFHRDSFSFPNASRILALTDKEEACRSYTAHLLVIDEAARVNAEAIEAARCTLSRTDGRMWMMSTPRGRTGKFYRYWVNGPSDWFRMRSPSTRCPT